MFKNFMCSCVLICCMSMFILQVYSLVNSDGMKGMLKMKLLSDLSSYFETLEYMSLNQGFNWYFGVLGSIGGLLYMLGFLFLFVYCFTSSYSGLVGNFSSTLLVYFDSYLNDSKSWLNQYFFLPMTLFLLFLGMLFMLSKATNKYTPVLFEGFKKMMCLLLVLATITPLFFWAYLVISMKGKAYIFNLMLPMYKWVVLGSLIFVLVFLSMYVWMVAKSGYYKEKSMVLIIWEFHHEFMSTMYKSFEKIMNSMGILMFKFNIFLMMMFGAAVLAILLGASLKVMVKYFTQIMFMPVYKYLATKVKYFSGEGLPHDSELWVMSTSVIFGMFPIKFCIVVGFLVLLVVVSKYTFDSLNSLLKYKINFNNHIKSAMHNFFVEYMESMFLLVMLFSYFFYFFMVFYIMVKTLATSVLVLLSMYLKYNMAILGDMVSLDLSDIANPMNFKSSSEWMSKMLPKYKNVLNGSLVPTISLFFLVIKSMVMFTFILYYSFKLIIKSPKSTSLMLLASYYMVFCYVYNFYFWVLKFILYSLNVLVLSVASVLYPILNPIFSIMLMGLNFIYWVGVNVWMYLVGVFWDLFDYIGIWYDSMGILATKCADSVFSFMEDYKMNCLIWGLVWVHDSTLETMFWGFDYMTGSKKWD